MREANGARAPFRLEAAVDSKGTSRQGLLPKLSVRIGIRLGGKQRRTPIAAACPVFCTSCRRESGLRIGKFRAGPIIDDSHFFQGHESAAHHRVDDRQEGIYLFFRIRDFDDERQVQ